METPKNIVIGDDSAYYFYLHRQDAVKLVESNRVELDPLNRCAITAEDLSSFNVDNAYYGPHPIKLLVADRSARRTNDEIACALCSPGHPRESFIKLRDNLYVISPELAFLRLASICSSAARADEATHSRSSRSNASIIRLAEIGIELCGTYHFELETDAIRERQKALTTPHRLARYLAECGPKRGVARARHALEFVLPGSASPMEGKLKLQMCHPMYAGGFGMPFTVLNYKLRADRRPNLAEQSSYSVDLANPKLKVGMEFDGELYHQDTSKDKRRRNELIALGWTIFPLENDVLYNPDKTIRLASQVAKHLGIRLCYSKSWEKNFVQLRHDLDLPV